MFTPFHAPHLAAVGLAHLASATPPLAASADAFHAGATRGAGASEPLAAAPASGHTAATTAAEAAVAPAAGAAAVASPQRAALQQPALADPALLQSPGLPPKPPAMAKRQRSGPVVRQLSSQATDPSPPQQATSDAAAQSTGRKRADVLQAGPQDDVLAAERNQPPAPPRLKAPGAAALALPPEHQRQHQQHAAADPHTDAGQPAAGLGVGAARNKRMDLLASAAVSQAPSAEQQASQPTHSAAISPTGAAAALLALQPDSEEADNRDPAAHEQPPAASGAAAGSPMPDTEGAGAAEGPAAEAKAASGSEPDVIDLVDTSVTDSPADDILAPTHGDPDADSGATGAVAGGSGSWRDDVGGDGTMQQEDAPQPGSRARSGKPSSQRTNNRKRKAAGGSVPSSGNSGVEQPRTAASSPETAADSQQPAAARWTSVKSFWYVPPGKTKPVKVMDVNALAQETSHEVRQQHLMLDRLTMRFDRGHGHR